MTVSKLLSGPRGHQAKIAKATHLSRAHITNLRTGKRDLTLSMARVLASATGTEFVLDRGQIRFVRPDRRKALR